MKRWHFNLKFTTGNKSKTTFFLTLLKWFPVLSKSWKCFPELCSNVESSYPALNVKQTKKKSAIVLYLNFVVPFPTKGLITWWICFVKTVRMFCGTFL